MKRTVVAILVMILVVMMFCACGHQNSDVDYDTKDEMLNYSADEFEEEKIEESDGELDEGEENIEEESVDVPNIKIASILPDPQDYFKQGEFNVIVQDNGANYFIRVTNYQDGEYEAYVNACKEGKFSKVHYEDDTVLMAYTEDESYYLQVPMVESAEAIDIICNFVTED